MTYERVNYSSLSLIYLLQLSAKATRDLKGFCSSVLAIEWRSRILKAQTLCERLGVIAAIYKVAGTSPAFNYI